MYKWHASSAIGRPRGDIADGIASSLRLFHITSSNAAETSFPRISRTKLSAAAAAEVSSLSPDGPRGIDARSLAAKSPQGFKITRVDVGDAVGRGGSGSRTSTFLSRGRGRGGAGFSGRGGMRGRGVGRGRGRGGRGGKRERTSLKTAGALEEDPFTPTEQAYVTGMAQGFRIPYSPNQTTRQSVEAYVPPVPVSMAGVVESILDRMRALSGQRGTEEISWTEHMRQYQGNGTLFHNGEEVPPNLNTLPKEERRIILQTLGAGQYSAPKPANKADTLGLIDSYGWRNETYLPEDTTKLKAKVASLLPAQAAARPAKQAAKK